jgi:endoglucanase
MNRRTAIQYLALYGIAFAGSAYSREPRQDQNSWSAWKHSFLSSDGRIIDDGNGEISHSEGQGFGALLAQAHGDRQAFNLIEEWTQKNLLVRQDPLMAWRWYAGTGVALQDRVTFQKVTPPSPALHE